MSVLCHRNLKGNKQKFFEPYSTWLKKSVEMLTSCQELACCDTPDTIATSFFQTFSQLGTCSAITTCSLLLRDKFATI